MNWKKLGLIFDHISNPSLPNCVDFAQSPQALVFDNFVRIYFSTRERDGKTHKFHSHVSYVDMTKDFREVIDVAREPVIPLGELGCFDEHGIFPVNVLRVDKKVYAYTCGWSRRVGVSVETAIGLAVSTNEGRTFERIGHGPVLAASLHEPCLVGDGFVKQFNGMFHMWYIFGLPWQQFAGQSEPDRIYKIGYATSQDGIEWDKHERQHLITDSIDRNECQALPTVIQYDDSYHMYFCYRHASDFRSNANRGYRIGYAFSDDLSDWTRDDVNVGISLSPDPNEWDSEMMCYPHVFECDERIYMLYNGNSFGRRGFGLAIAE